MNDETRRAIDEAVARAIAAKDVEIASAIADGLRTFADRPAGEKGSPSLQFGEVEEIDVDNGFAYVLLDGQSAGVPINMLGGLVEGERVAVLLVPPSGSLAIGMVTPAAVPSVTPGGGSPVTDYYTTSPSGTNVASATLVALAWPTLTAGPGILDLSTIDAPLTLYAGEYTINASVYLGAGEMTGGNAGEKLFGFIRVLGGVDLPATFVDSTTVDASYLLLTSTVVLPAGSPIEIMVFNIDTGITVSLQVSNVVVTGPSS